MTRDILYLTRYMIGHYARMGKRWLLKAKG